eukprot:TRINITY_DN42045_c0_g2_i1.p1 TRINITY_DN42045_c0_g2~~TRINITY_DN42045_c0_g2_i1.p1  ORF type:complete len:117 (+),score=24.61 TRINITY_DN42045_c0_g2_i1:528-878(+)
MSLTRIRVSAMIGRPPQMAGLTAIRGKPARVMAGRLSDMPHLRYSSAMPDDPPDFEGFDASDFDPPPHLMSPEDPVAYDAWFRAQVEAAIADPRPDIPHEVVMKEMQAILDRHKKS